MTGKNRNRRRPAAAAGTFGGARRPGGRDRGRTDGQLIVKAASPDQRAALAQSVKTLLDRDYPGMEALSNAELKSNVTKAINQQFGFFNAIVAIAVRVGVLGIVNTLTTSVLERTREIGVLRALGASRWVLGMRSTTFPGLTMHLPVTMLLTITVLGVVAGVLAAILPARRAAKLDPLAALRYE